MTTTTHSLRWLLRSDIPAVMQLAGAHYVSGWREEHFRLALRERNCVGRVVERNGQMLAFAIYELAPQHLAVLTWAAGESAAAECLFRSLIDRLNQRRRRLMVCASERYLTDHLLLAHCGLTATRVLPEYYNDGTDAYQFEYCLPGLPRHTAESCPA